MTRWNINEFLIEEFTFTKKLSDVFFLLASRCHQGAKHCLTEAKRFFFFIFPFAFFWLLVGYWLSFLFKLVESPSENLWCLWFLRVPHPRLLSFCFSGKWIPFKLDRLYFLGYILNHINHFVYLTTFSLVSNTLNNAFVLNTISNY